MTDHLDDERNGYYHDMSNAGAGCVMLLERALPWVAVAVFLFFLLR